MISITEAPWNIWVQWEITGDQIDEFLREDFNANLLLSIQNNPEWAIDIEKFIWLCLESINTLVQQEKIPEHLFPRYQALYQDLKEAKEDLNNTISYEDKFIRLEKLIYTQLSEYIDKKIITFWIQKRVDNLINWENPT